MTALSYKEFQQLLVGSSPGRDLLGGDLPQIVDLGGLASDSAGGYLGDPAHNVLGNEGIGSRRRLDTNNTDTGVVLRPIVGAISQISQPGLQRLVVVLLDQRSICDDASLSSNGSPFSGGVDEGDVDVRVAGEVVGLAGLCVGMEEKIDTLRFLSNISTYCKGHQ
jgi:hypothetical protein